MKSNESFQHSKHFLLTIWLMTPLKLYTFFRVLFLDLCIKFANNFVFENSCFLLDFHWHFYFKIHNFSNLNSSFYIDFPWYSCINLGSAGSSWAGAGQSGQHGLCRPMQRRRRSFRISSAAAALLSTAFCTANSRRDVSVTLSHLILRAPLLQSHPQLPAGLWLVETDIETGLAANRNALAVWWDFMLTRLWLQLWHGSDLH